MTRKTTARRFSSRLLNSRLALFAFAVSALGLPIGMLPVSSAIAEQPAKQGPTSSENRRSDKATAEFKEAIQPDSRDSKETEQRNGALQRQEAFQQKKQPEPTEPISWWTVFAFGFLGFSFAASGIPFILEKVPPNPWHGFRVQATLENPAVWYPANRFLGKCLLGFGLFVLATSVGLSFIPRINPMVYLFSIVGALIMGTNTMVILCFLFLQSLSPQRVTHRDMSAK